MTIEFEALNREGGGAGHHTIKKTESGWIVDGLALLSLSLKTRDRHNILYIAPTANKRRTLNLQVFVEPSGCRHWPYPAPRR